MNPVGRGSPDFEDKIALTRSAYVEKPYGHRTPSPSDFLAMSGQTKVLNNGPTDGADKGDGDFEGWNALPFACGGWGEEKRDMSVEKRERGGSTHGVADADDGQSILIVHTYRYLFVLDMKENQKQCNPTLVRKIDLYKYNFPLEMGLLKLEKDKVYMFGGFKECSSKKSYPSLEISCNTLVYELSSKLAPKVYPWYLNLTSEVDSIKAPKVFPWVAYIDDKILVVDGEYGCKGSSKQFLEFYDLPSKTWKEFPQIPTQESWSKEEEAIITSRQDSVFLLVGYKLYIRFGKEAEKLYFCLNTRTQEWDLKSASNFCETLRLSLLRFPHCGTSISKVDGLDADQNIILKQYGGNIYAYLIDDSGSLLCYQDLVDELCRDIRPNYSNKIVFIDLKRGGEVCMVLINHPSLVTECGFYVEQSILIRHFELKLKKDLKVPFKKIEVRGARVPNEFVNVEIFKTWQCPLRLKDYELALCDAVLL